MRYNRSKPGACRHLSFATNPYMDNYLSYNLTFKCQNILKDAVFENGSN